MTRARDILRVLRYAALAGYRDEQVIYTWKTWLGGWYVRIVFQVAFFALIGKLLASTEKTHYLLVGNAILVAAVVCLFAVAQSAWERWTGTLPLLVASPTSPVVVFSGRAVVVMADALLSSLGAFFVVAPIFGLPLPWPRVLFVVPLAVLVALSAYSLAIFLGGWVIRAPSTRNVVANVTHTTLMAIAGVNVPLAFYPDAVQWVAQLLPVTHGLQAIRELLAGAPAGAILPDVGLEALVGLCWLLLALATFERFAEKGRRDGSIEFGG